MFPSPLRDVMHRPRITGEKSPPAPLPRPSRRPLFFHPPIVRRNAPQMRRIVRFSLAPRCRRRRDARADADRYFGQYALCRISRRVYLNGILYAVSTWRSLSIARPLPPTSSSALPLPLSRDDACLIVFCPFIRATRVNRDL